MVQKMMLFIGMIRLNKTEELKEAV